MVHRPLLPHHGRVDLVLFDVNETLFSLDRMRRAFEEAGVDGDAVPHWFARTLRDGFALAAAQDHRPFADIAVAALEDVVGLPAERGQRVLVAFRELDPHPDVEPALALLAEAEVPVATLTVGASEVTDALLARAGLAGYVRRTLSADAVGRFKPAAAPYLWAVHEMGATPARTALVAAHGWDVHGARRAGLRTGWVSRLERRPSPVFDRADVVGDDLPEVVRGVLGLDVAPA